MRRFLALLLVLGFAMVGHAYGAPLSMNGRPVQLDIRPAGERGVRITLKPTLFESAFPVNPALIDRVAPPPVVSLRELDGAVRKRVGTLTVEVRPSPLTVRVMGEHGALIQTLTFENDGGLGFVVDGPVLGMGEGGPLPQRGENWREAKVEFDRRGRVHAMQPRWQADMYGSRNPVGLLIGTKGWGLYVASPWGQFDLTQETRGTFTPRGGTAEQRRSQNHGDQRETLGKGIPPFDAYVPGLYDVFVFDARDPAAMMKDVSLISGPAVLPPRWALGYMQSHRTLEDDAQMVEVVDTFRRKQIPLDAVIYLGTGFTPRGWNTPQPSLSFNPEVFTREPRDVVADLHERNVRVAVHVVPWDRDGLPTLHGDIPPTADEDVTDGHLARYWLEHVPLVEAGVDAWWPDEGDWFDLFERFKRHQLYYQGPLSTTPNVRPWSLHRNGHLGIARWGGWVWSGDTESTWKALEAQIAVGLNHSLSLSPFWGSDIGGFFPTEELTGDLYARWFQFAAFTPSFRAHGRTWWTRLPWGWGLSDRGPLESRTPPLESSMNNPAIEPIVKRYAELRYRLLSYHYTLAWEARETGMPMMRALWLHHPEDVRTHDLGDQYLWGEDLLIAPVYERGATARDVYLPEGIWYDWWTNEQQAGGETITRAVDLATMPIYVRAGAILPWDPPRQHTGQPVDEPLTIRVYPGRDGRFILYEDDGKSLDYLNGAFALTAFRWNDAERTLEIERRGAWPGTEADAPRTLMIELMPDGPRRAVELSGPRTAVSF